ncbi:hypothetical protein SAMN02910297_00010 [Methanobrevibacter olleyae]|uniref:Uncharacterized protein n=1 Tax=Methanobrevibacter olleyae TaxID=294671 RepID=A0A1I4FD63_METOL|nr:hypothetical protein [Methanobrevibacter olleyae]SFL14766.1 hypothetical protein SAMN02910297_00010 [Methanobrevibacter olleyae]
MKVVVCKNCGAKYQLDDEDDINAFECSVCSGNLEEFENFSNNEKGVSSDYNSQNVSNSIVVYCTNCGLKYQLTEDDDINEFECNSCGGSLDYVSNMDSTSTYSTTSTNFIDNPLTENIVIDDETEIDEIVPIHAESQVDEIVPIHAESQVDEIVPIYAESEVDEIIPIHAEANFDDGLDEIVPIHAEANFDDGLDEIVPIHRELNAQSDEYLDSDYYYETESALPDVDTLESNYDEGEMISYGSIYDSSLGDSDDIVPIHAEKRHMETSRDISSGFAYKSNYDGSDIYQYAEELESQEARLVEVTDIPEDELPESPVSLGRQELSEEDQKLFSRVQNEMVFDSPEEYEAFKLARYKYYVFIIDILKDDYIKSMDKEFYKESSVKRLIKKGEESVKRGNLTAGEDDALVNQATIDLMKSQNRAYEPKKTYADVYILMGAFVLIVFAAYYFFVSGIWYVLITVALGILILSFGIYKKYTFNNYIARGRIIRERLLALPSDFYVFYAVQPPQSKDIINHVVVGPTGLFTILSKRYDSKEYKNKVKSDNETDAMVNDSASIQNYMDRKNTLELQTDYDDNQSRFQFGNEEIHFVNNSQIKRKALELNEDLAIFLDNKGFSGIYIEPLIGFVNDDLAILNVILTNEDLFIDELFNKMIRGQRRIDELTVAKIARLLSYYSTDCSVV